MLKIYGVPISVHTRKVIVAAIEKGLPHEVIPVVPVIPTNPPPNWRQLSPTGKIPVLVDDDLTIADSAVICAYLERTHPAQPIYPSSTRDYIQALWLEQYAGGTLFRELVHPLFREVFVQPKVNKVAPDQAKIDAVLGTVAPEIFGYLESVAGDAFLAGPKMSVGDIAVASNLITYQYMGFALDAAQYSKLSALFERVIRQPAMQQAVRREQSVVRSMGLRNEFLSSVLA